MKKYVLVFLAVMVVMLSAINGLGENIPIDPFCMRDDGVIKDSNGMTLAKKTQRTKHVELVSSDRELKSADFLQVGGVLFRTCASLSPDYDKSQISLSFSEQNNESRRLLISFSDKSGKSQTFSPEMPVWVWGTAAKFADSKYTALITRYWKATNEEEVLFEENEMENGNTVEWIGYHEVIEDSIVGVFLLMADYINQPVFLMNFMSDDLVSRLKTDNYFIEALPIQQENAFQKLHEKLSPGPNEWDTYMLNDVEASFIFQPDKNKFTINGFPCYQFGSRSQNGFTENRELTNYFRKNRSVVTDLNPSTYRVVDDFARMSSFFRSVKRNNPMEYRRFLNSLEKIYDEIPTANTPSGFVKKARLHWLFN